MIERSAVCGDFMQARLSRRGFCALALSICLHDAARAAAPWPSRPVKIIVPGGSGGVIDLRARWLANELLSAVAQPMIVENHAGAGGIIGMRIGAHSPADGYTLVIVHQGTMVMNPFIYDSLPYDPLHDFIPITRLGIGSLALVVNPSLPAKTVDALVTLGKSRARPLTFGSPGVGTPPHLAVELFKRETGMPALHVPYRDGNMSASALIGGQIDFEIEGLTVVRPLVDSARLRVLATTGEARVAGWPDVPTMREAGVHEYVFEGWVGVAVPAGTPAATVSEIYDAMARVLDTDRARTWFAGIGAEPGAIPPAAFTSAIRGEYAKWKRVIHDAGIKAE